MKRTIAALAINILAVIFSIIALILCFLAPTARGANCPGGDCPSCPGTRLKQFAPAWRPSALRASAAHPAVPRIFHRIGNRTNACAGVLIHKYPNKDLALVVTAAHLFTGGRGQVEVRFPSGDRYAARVERVDHVWDLAILAIRRPRALPVAFASARPAIGSQITAGGYPGGRPYRTVCGRFTRWVGPGGGQPFDMLDVEARVVPGDSGGPLFDAGGRLVGLISGCAGRYTTGPCFTRIRAMLHVLVGGTGSLARGVAQAALGVRRRSPPARTTAAPGFPGPIQSKVAPGAKRGATGGMITPQSIAGGRPPPAIAGRPPPTPATAAEVAALRKTVLELAIIIRDMKNHSHPVTPSPPHTHPPPKREKPIHGSIRIRVEPVQ